MTSGITRTVICTMHTMVLPAFFDEVNRDSGWGGGGGAALIKKESLIFLINKEIQLGSVAKSYLRKGFLIYEVMRKYLTDPV
jgi:hypothetical protein